MNEGIYCMVIRYNGLKKNIFNYIFKTIDIYKSIEIKAIYNVKWSEEEKEEKLLSFYDHITSKEAIKDIMKVNGLLMVVMILYDSTPVEIPAREIVSGKNWNMIRIKRRIRDKFGNVIHLSDSTMTAYDEIYKLLDINEKELLNIVMGDGININELATNSYLAKHFNKDQKIGVELYGNRKNK
jgi:hypothetical protein